MTTNTYLLKEGYDNLKKHASKTFSTMFVICATMFILGVFLIIFQNVNENVDKVVEEQGVQAIIKDGLTDEEIEYIKDQIGEIKGVKSIDYKSKDDAYNDALEVFKDYEYFMEGLETVKPFSAFYVVKFTNISYSDEVVSKLKKIDGIYNVKYNEVTMNAIKTISKVSNIALLGIGSVMTVISIFIISNTIKLAVYSNKREIFIMKYIGATNKFIEKPFIIEGVIIGILSAMITFIITSIIYLIAYARIGSVQSSLGIFGLIPYTSLWYIILIVYVLLGIFIGMIGSKLAMRKYVKV